MFPFKTVYWAMLCGVVRRCQVQRMVGYATAALRSAVPRPQAAMVWLHRGWGEGLWLRVWWWAHSCLGGITSGIGSSVLEPWEGSRWTRFSLGDLNSTCALGTFFNHLGVPWFSKTSLQLTWSWSWISCSLPTYQDSSWRKRQGRRLSGWWPLSRWHNCVVQIYVTSYFSSTLFS